MADKESSETIFNKLNVDPQLYINEVLNHVDSSIDAAFQFFHQEASKLVNNSDVTKSQDLQKGITYIQNAIQGSLDKRFSMWEIYCLHHVFTVPSGISLPPEDEAPDHDSMDQDNHSDEQVEAQLDTLRNSLAEAEKECAELETELKALKRNSALNNEYISSVDEALQLYEKSSAHEMFQEMLKVGSELRSKVEQLNSKKMEAIESNWRELRINATNGDMADLNFGGALSKLRLDELQDLLAKMKS